MPLRVGRAIDTVLSVTLAFISRFILFYFLISLAELEPLLMFNFFVMLAIYLSYLQYI